MKQQVNTCEDRIERHLKSRVQDLQRLWRSYCAGEESVDGEHICEYGLSFDFVAPHTFDGQREGYFRYQLSYGGPSDEFRFFANPDLSCHRIEYRFLDWFDGAYRTLSGSDEALLIELWDWFCECGTAQDAFRKAEQD